MCISTAITHANKLGRGGRGFKWKKIALAYIMIICMQFNPVMQQADQLYIGTEFRLSGCATGWPVIYQDKVQAQRAGQFYIGIEFRLSGCATGWPVIYWDRVQAIRLLNGLGSFRV